MSPEPEVQVNYNDTTSANSKGFTVVTENTAIDVEGKENVVVAPITTTQTIVGVTVSGETSELLAPRKRERRTQSPSVLTLSENFTDAMSPASSSSASQANSVDATFEPTIEMMVNDFDDEGTLNEEEALAALECQDPHDEIATLREESEMPLEELLAKYSALPPPPLVRKKTKKTQNMSNKRNKSKKQDTMPTQNTANSNNVEAEAPFVDNPTEQMSSDNSGVDAQSDVIVIESGDEDNPNEEDANNALVEDVPQEEEDVQALNTTNNTANESDVQEPIVSYTQAPTEVVKMRRSHLLDLYPEETLNSIVQQGDGKVIPLEMLYAEDDDDDDEIEEEDADSDYIKKTIMVGNAYQAVIPTGLSQYGDVLPYENEDKLIWEPSQVSEREVEEYLLKARDIKPTLTEDDDEQSEVVYDEALASKEQVNNVTSNETTVGVSNEKLTTSAGVALDNNVSATSGNNDNDVNGVVKDNEQALLLLVQCGYDFKEALRRKRLNALPMTDAMSIWSEEECHKFEEGIQKFGKDFLKIRQNQVRTRSMRELVQFYYLWKKSERRDHEFANANTVDHMDIYLNEGNDYAPNASSAALGCPASGHGATTTGGGTRKAVNCTQKNFSIMTGGGTTTVNSNATTMPTVTHSTSASHNRKRSASGSGVGTTSMSTTATTTATTIAATSTLLLPTSSSSSAASLSNNESNQHLGNATTTTTTTATTTIGCTK